MSYRGVLLSSFTGLCIVACGSTSNHDALTEAVGEAEVGTVLLHTGYSGFDERQRLLVQDSVDWARAWATAFALHTEIPPRPMVDFRRDIVVVAALGARPSGGYDIAIDGVVREGEGATVLVVTAAPGADCVVTAAITTPVVMVRVPAVAGRVQFSERAQTLSCE